MPYILQPDSPSNWVGAESSKLSHVQIHQAPPRYQPGPVTLPRQAVAMSPFASAQKNSSVLNSGGGGTLPRHNHVNMGGAVPNSHPNPTILNIGPEGEATQESIVEAQIIPQDDNWGDNATAVTGNTSVSDSREALAGPSLEPPQRSGSASWSRYVCCGFGLLLCMLSVLSPVVMVLMPHVGLIELSREQMLCGAECDGILISFSFKLLLLMIGFWAVFLRMPRATMPRIFTFRALALVLLILLTFAFWLFYIVRVLERSDTLTMLSILQFSSSLVDALLFLHYSVLCLIELKHLQPQYSIKVVRSPDGESKSYCMGQLSIQRAAVWVLEHYYSDFPVYNPYLEQVPLSKSRKHHGSDANSFKFYDVDGLSNPGLCVSETAPAEDTNTRRRRDSTHNERFYEEHEYERRVKKRRARLVTAAEEAFTHIRRVNEENGGGAALDSFEAAQAIFPGLSKPLQKYLRITRQQPRHTMDSIIEHLANCLQHGLSPRAFLEKFSIHTPVLQGFREHVGVQDWALVCETLLTRPVKGGTVFLLKQGDISLLCTVTRTPHYNLTEQIIHPKGNKFLLRVNSETSV